MAVAEYGNGAHPVQHKCHCVPWGHDKAEVRALGGVLVPTEAQHEEPMGNLGEVSGA